jgi:predicted helicase
VDYLGSFRPASVGEHVGGAQFEELILCYLKNEAAHIDVSSDVWTYADWTKTQGLAEGDAVIDLVAKGPVREVASVRASLYVPGAPFIPRNPAGL